MIGGSLAFALERHGVSVRVWAREGSLPRVRESFGDATSDLREAVAGVDTVVLCTPVGAMKELAEAFAPALREDTLVTDAASVKSTVATTLEPLFGTSFVGSHPMAGSEKSGLHAARADLYERATCIICPPPQSPSETIQRIESLWQLVGCRTLQMDAQTHDRLVARASHLPHALASILVETVAGGCREAMQVTGSGFRDTTRIASGPHEMWAEIFMENREEVLASLSEFRDTLSVFTSLLQEGSHDSLCTFLRTAREAREALIA